MDTHPSQLPIPFHESSEQIPDSGIAKVLDRMRQRHEQEAIAAGLPDWPENKRGLPNGALRSALFGISPKERRTYAVERHVASIEGLAVFITRGPNLMQHHLDVWEQCLRLGKDQGTGRRIEFTAYAFLKSIGRNTGKSDCEWLKNALYDLAACVVRITDGNRTYFGPLIHGGTRDELTGRYVIEINPKIALLYGAGRWTQLDYAQRQQLRRHPLAQWLHAFYSTHASPYRYKVETIRNLCGADKETELKKFRQVLRRALTHLEAATAWRCCIDDGDCVVVEKQGRCQIAIGIAGTVLEPELSTNRPPDTG
ncbi:plasmid replication initiator TrfA [Azovibrio restrictus]|uniref:plasmid replication initiator TrfA n=1 Tax=Azovibrio restrictus TaxID=146938 RepID=UPI0026EBCF4E|nr:plasmid replication initiator TrfA [Azovibrio restrictus]